MEILPGIEILDKALWLPKNKLLAIADLHIGYEEALVEEGFLVPKQMLKEIKKELKRLLRLKPKEVVINGDLKHEFGKISKQEWRDTLEILDLLLNKRKVVLIKGNHDNILEPIARKKGLEIKDFYCLDSICFLHGHKILSNKKINSCKTLVIAHEHPAVTITDGVKQELYKCFLLGKWRSKNLVVMPSFFTLYEGSDVKKESLFSPYLKKVENFEVFVIGEEIYYFGKLKQI